MFQKRKKIVHARRGVGSFPRKTRARAGVPKRHANSAGEKKCARAGVPKRHANSAGEKKMRARGRGRRVRGQIPRSAKKCHKLGILSLNLIIKVTVFFLHCCCCCPCFIFFLSSGGKKKLTLYFIHSS